MSSEQEKTANEKSSEIIRKWLKDIIYVILFLIAAGGWLSSEISEKQAVKDTINNNTVALEGIKSSIDKINNFMLEQQKLNGKFEQHMKDHE